MTKAQLDTSYKKSQNFLEQKSKNLWIFSICWLVLISWIGFFWNLGSIGLVDKTEPMFVEAARQMVVTGDWVTPYWNGETRFDKPPLSYWLMALTFKLFGVNEWAARIPSALMAMALVILGFYTLRYFGISNPLSFSNTPQQKSKLWLSAWLGAGIIALNPAWIAWARTGVSDMYLSSSIAMAMLSFFLGYANPGKEAASKSKFSAKEGWYILFYVFMALAVLAKGPIGVVLPVFIITAFLFYVGKFKEVLPEMKLLRGSLIFSAIAMPWFILVTLANGQEYINVFFGYHNLQRFTSVVSYHPGPWYYFIPVVLVGLIPWSIYLPVAVIRIRFWDYHFWRSSNRATHLSLFAFFWFTIIFLFFSASSTKLPSYILPAMPAAAIIVTLFLIVQFDKKNKLSKQERKLLIISGIFNVIILIALAVASFISPSLVGGDPRKPEFSSLLQQSGLPILGGLIWGLAALGTLFLLLRRRDWRWLWIPNLIGFMAFISFIALPVAQIRDKDSQLPLRQISALITQVRQPGEELLLVGFIRPSLVFYTRQNVEFFNSHQRLIEYLEKPENKSQTAPTILLITEQKYIDRLGLLPRDYQLLDQKGVYQVLRVDKNLILSKK